MKNKEQFIKDIKKILRNSDKFKPNGMLVQELGLNDEEYPSLFQCAEIEVKIIEFDICKAYINPCVEGLLCDEGCWVKYEDMPYKALRSLHKIIKKHLK